MIFHKTPVQGAQLVELQRRGDDRGFFARLYCEQEFADAGLPFRIVQANISLNAQARTLRGMHYQLPPAAEQKLVRCLRGALWDVALDLRPDSPSFGRWFGAELNAENRLMMYVPRGCAHGFVTLSDDVEVLYLMGAAYAPEQERGVRWDDPRFSIGWPVQPRETSPKDAAWPVFDPNWHGIDQMRGLV
jgi:dTDP-4-dehydrorhamnose 3,5-epimerase